MLLILRLRPRAGTLLGILALAIAGFGGVRALQARGVHDADTLSPAPRAAVNLKFLTDSSAVAGGSFTTLGLDCAEGQRVIAGGFWDSRQNVFSAGSYPYIVDGVGKGWTVTASNVPPLVKHDAEVEAHVLCVRPGQPVVPPQK